jgi:peptide/nickel transport system substrate-binding protein
MRSFTAWGRTLLAAAAMAGGLVAAAHAAPEKTLTVGIQADLSILDPLYTTARVTSMYGMAVYDTLFAYDAAGKPQPQMVGSYTVSPDSLTYQFTLRPGLKWSDGKPVTAADCVASLQRWEQRQSMGVNLAKFTKTMEAVDDNTFRIVLKEPYGLVLASLAKRPPGAPFMMPERLAKTPAGQRIKESVGSGPFIFKMDEWQPGNRAVFVRNPNYVPRQEPANGMAGGKVVKVDRMVWRYLPDQNSALSALKVGAIDYLDEVPFDFVPVLKADPNIKLPFTNNGNPGIIRPNHLQPPFDNALARQALIYLVDQPEFMNAAIGDPDLYMKFCGAYFICGSENATEAGSEPFRTKNIAKAAELFKEAGYKGEPVVLLVPTDRPLYKAWAMVLLQNLRQAGVKVDPQAETWSAITARREIKGPPAKGGWNLFVTAAPPTGTDPMSSPYFNPACDHANSGWPCDPKILKMMDQWSRQPDEAKRRTLIDEIQRQAYQSVPFAILGQYRQPVAVRANINGVLNAGDNVFWNISKD